jgi:GH24 family phage-related lysozyme (muramidase)
MAAQNILRSYLVGLGFKIDDQEWKRFDAYWKKISDRFISLSAQATAASLEVAAAVSHIADQLTDLYYVSQRTSSSVGGIQAFTFGAKQIGLTAEQATQALEGLAGAMRMQPGTNGVLASFGIDPNGKDRVETMMKLINVLRRMPYYQGAAYAQMFGIDEQTFLMLSKNFDQMKAAMEARKQMAQAYGLDPQKLSAQSRQFHNDVEKIKERFEVLGMVLARDFLPVMEWAVRMFDRMLGMLGPLDRATGGWSTRLLAVAVALLSVNRAMAVARWGLRGLGILKSSKEGLSIGEKIFGPWVARMLGLGRAGGGVGAGGAAGTATAAEGAAAGAAGGLGLVTGGLIAAAASLLAVALSKDLANWVREKLGIPEHVGKKELKNGLLWTQNEAKAVGTWIATGFHQAAATPLGKSVAQAVSQAAAKAAPVTKVLSQVAAQATDTMMQMIGRSEGFRATKYWDKKGYSIGYGHQIQPGENFDTLTRPQALALLAKDVAKYSRHVAGVVGRALTSNQLGALTSLAYNIGTAAFDKSTLLRKVQAGDFQGAAAEFGRWNKVRSGNGTFLADAGLTARRAMEAKEFSRSSPLSVTPVTTIHIQGSVDEPTLQKMKRYQTKINCNLVRDLAGAIDTPGAK